MSYNPGISFWKGDMVMKKAKVLCAVVAGSMLFSACSDAKKTADTSAATTTTTAATTQETEESSEEETTVTETEVTGPVEVTLDNYFDTDPSVTEWGMTEEAADIVSLVDMDYIESSYEDVFYVEDASDLASLTYFINTYPYSRMDPDDHLFVKVDLMADIDLSGYRWAPMGIRVGDDHEQGFAGIFAGNGHTISGLTISNDNDFNGFFGDIYGSAVCGLYLEDASISGVFATMFTGYLEDVRFFDCSASGVLPDNVDIDTVYLFPSQDGPGTNRFISCRMSVTNADGALIEDDFTLNPFPEGMGNAMLELYDPDGDGVFEYGTDYFEEY